MNIKTAGDWLKVKRLERNLTLGHVSEKMGIATSLVCSWESSTRHPDSQQLKVLATVLNFDAKDFEVRASATCHHVPLTTTPNDYAGPNASAKPFSDCCSHGSERMLQPTDNGSRWRRLPLVAVPKFGIAV